jgi:hypothetical protein
MHYWAWLIVLLHKVYVSYHDIGDIGDNVPYVFLKKFNKIRPAGKKVLLAAAIAYCMMTGAVYASTPTLGTVNPASGTTAPNIAKTFTCAYSDTSGWQHLKNAYFLISTAPTVLANSAYLYYDQNSNLLYMRDDTNAAWLGGYAPGSANAIENSSAKIDCAATTVSGTGNTLTVAYNFTFKTAFSGKTYSTYLSATDDANLTAAWSKKGSYTINTTPQTGTIIPALGIGQTETQQQFSTTYIDQDGWQNIQAAYLLINSSTGATNCFYGYYDQNTNKLYLRNDANTAWLGGFSPGSGTTIENSYARINCSQTTVAGSGTTLTVVWSVILKKPFTGAKYTYLYIKDDVNAYAGWIRVGLWIITNTAPQNGTVAPSFGASIPGTTFYITTSYIDPDSWQNIQYSYFLISTSATTLANCVYAYCDASTGKLYLRNDANTAWLGGYIPGSSNTIENSSAQISCSATTVTGSSNTITIQWVVRFKAAFVGTKNVYLSVRDIAGAQAALSQKGTWVALDSGQVIGPEGGQVVSSDGKVKAVIPAGALNYPTAISIASVSKAALQGSTPAGTTLLSAVECKPYNLVFNKPIDIIYTLDQAEVPGTPVELGLYDSVQKKIISTGQVSTISAGGYNVCYPIMHFSTYAALKSLTPQGAPIGAGVKVPLPDLLTGSYSHAIPVTVAPGRKKMQPVLSLTYRSSNPNSWVGVGFNLNPGYIVRSTRLGPPTYNDAQDTFYLITDAGTTELVNLINNLYQAKIESSFTKFYKQTDDSWKVVGKDGSALWFGQAADAREGSSHGTFSWYLTKAVDTNGNYIAYTYVRDQGKCYLSRIDYTGNDSGVSPTNTVEFFLESRDDVASSYISSGRIATAKRLKEIRVTVNSSVAWRYELNYSVSQDTNRSLLISFTQYASDDKNLPVQIFEYQKAK